MPPIGYRTGDACSATSVVRRHFTMLFCSFLPSPPCEIFGLGGNMHDVPCVQGWIRKSTLYCRD